MLIVHSEPNEILYDPQPLASAIGSRVENSKCVGLRISQILLRRSIHEQQFIQAEQRLNIQRPAIGQRRF
jgi:hypothetical protein